MFWKISSVPLHQHVYRVLLIKCHTCSNGKTWKKIQIKWQLHRKTFWEKFVTVVIGTQREFNDIVWSYWITNIIFCMCLKTLKNFPCRCNKTFIFMFICLFYIKTIKNMFMYLTSAFQTDVDKLESTISNETTWNVSKFVSLTNSVNININHELIFFFR